MEPSSDPTLNPAPTATGGIDYKRHLWVLALLPYFWLVERYDHLIDDAFISFRYAHHWAIGEGLRFNIGTGDPVEGFSNFLWVVLLAAGEVIGVLPEVLAPLAGVACGVLLLAWVYRFALDALDLGWIPALGAVIFLGSFPPFAVWSTGGLETCAFALALFASWAEIVRPQGPRYGRAAVFALAMVSLRPEGPAWAFGLILAAYLARGRDGVDRRLLKQYLVPFLIGFALLLVARWAYFGDIVSNTVRAKGGLSSATVLRGAKNAASFALIFISPAVLLFLAPVAWRLPRGKIVASATLMLASGVLWSVVVGGDWMPFFRFFAPLTPFLALLLGAVCARLGRLAVPFAIALVVCGVLPAFDVLLSPRGLREDLYFRSFKSRGYETEHARMRTGRLNGDRYRALGLAMAELAQPGDSLVQGAIGAVGYYSGMIIYDRNGLVERSVAMGKVSGSRSAGHDKLVPRIFFEDRKPTWYELRMIPPHSNQDQVRSAAKPVFRQFAEDGRLMDLCEPQIVEVPGTESGSPPFSLLLFRAVDSKARAREAWAKLGL